MNKNSFGKKPLVVAVILLFMGMSAIPSTGTCVDTDIDYNNPPTAPIFLGPTRGVVGESYRYTINSTDPDGDDVYYIVMWEPDCLYEWFGPYPSGEEVNIGQTWDERGTYYVLSQAMDIYNAVSGYTILEVIIGEIIYVDDDNTEGPWNGTIEYPYQYIQDGIDNAFEYDTVFVYSGVYLEELIIISKSINLIGENTNTTIIDGQGSTQGCRLIVLFKADYIQMKGFTIRDSYSPNWPYKSCGVRIMANYCEFTDNILVKHANTALEITDSYHHNMIFNNTISNSGVGILLRYSSHNMSIKGNQISKCSYGILSNSDRQYISHNNIFENGMGIYHNVGGYLIIDSNIISKNTMAGIYFDNNEWYDCTHNTVINNYFNNNQIAFILDMPSNNIENNTFILNKNGLRVSGSNNIIKRNNFIFNLINAQFINCNDNIWESNYWNIPRNKPKPIFGRILIIPWINFDWHPAREPYDIPMGV